MPAINTTVNKENLIYSGRHNLSGGLSGKPLYAKSNNLLKIAHAHDPQMFKICVGGVDSKEPFDMKLDLGASLVQIYSALTYNNLGFINEMNQELSTFLRNDCFSNVKEAVGIEIK